MKTSDFFKTSAKKLNESLGKTFGKTIDFGTFDMPKLEDARNKLRTQIHQVRNESGFNENMESDAYHEAQWMLDAINAEIAEREELLATGGTAEVTEEGKDFPEEEVMKLFKQFDDDAWDNMPAAAGNPDTDLAMKYARAGKLEAAAEVIANAYSGDDGDEVDLSGLYSDLIDDLNFVINGDKGEYAGDKNDGDDSIEKDYDIRKNVVSMSPDEFQKRLGNEEINVDELSLNDIGSAVSKGAAAVGNAVGAAAHKIMKGDKQEKPAVVTGPAKKPTKHKETPLMPPEHTDEDITLGMNKYGLAAVKGQDGFYSIREVDGKPEVTGGPFDSIDELKAHQEDLLNNESVESGEEMTTITEGEIQQASAIVTAKTMVDKVGRYIEEMSGMENETLLQLGDSIRDEMGQEQSKSFIETAAPAIQAALEALKQTRDTLASATRQLTGEEQATDMLGAEPAGEEPAGEMGDIEAPAPEAEAPADEFAAAEPAAGGMEAAGREQRESIQRENNLMKILAG